MKRVIFLMMSLTLMVTVMSSCSKIYSDASHEARSYEPIATAPITRPITANVEITDAGRVQESLTFDLTPIKGRRSLRKAKDLPYELKVQALAMVSQKYDADMIVAPTFSYEQEKTIQTIFGYTKIRKEVVKVTVTGYPAVYTDWKSVSNDSEGYEWISDFYGNKFGWEKGCNDGGSNVNVTINDEKK